MRTELIEISGDAPSEEHLQSAVDAIRRGQVVAIPTDTLYVLAADPFSLRAITAVFEAKGREPNRSLPILVESMQMAEDYAAHLTACFYLLARRFWPGPLTIIVPASPTLPLKVTGHTGRLAVRQSDAVVPNRLIEILGMPIIATSANRSGQPTCRSGFEVLGVMDGRTDLILDAGSIAGSGATTVDITDPDWKLIRARAISEDAIGEALQP